MTTELLMLKAINLIMNRVGDTSTDEYIDLTWIELQSEIIERLDKLTIEANTK